MIRLAVEDYCQECKAFSPVSTTIEYSDQCSYDPMSMTTKIIQGNVQTTIKCENAKRCAGIARHIRSEIGKKLESEGQNNDRES